MDFLKFQVRKKNGGNPTVATAKHVTDVNKCHKLNTLWHLLTSVAFLAIATVALNQEKIMNDATVGKKNFDKKF